MKKMILFISCLLAGVYANAQTPTLVKDMNPTGEGGGYYFTEFKGKTYFIASDGTNNGLYTTDGTAAGTQLFKQESSEIFSEFKGKLYFMAKDANGYELWATDGTVSGTQLVKDINPGPNSTGIHGFTALNNTQICFLAYDNTNGDELWVSDGTNSGTTLLKDIHPGALTSAALGLVSWNGMVYFIADDDAQWLNRQVWITDGTSNGTKILKDISPGTQDSVEPGFTPYKGKLYFRAGIGAQFGLCFTDGTTNGTQILVDKKSPKNLTVLYNNLYFTDRNELWVTDGTSGGTTLVKDLSLAAVSSYSYPKNFKVYNGKIYFSADNGVNGEELWVTDGTGAGTKMLKEIAPQTAASSPGDFTVYNGRLYFIANDYSSPYPGSDQIWVTDGNAANTHKVTLPNATTASPLNRDYFGDDYDKMLKVCNGSLFFRANYTSIGLEPYVLTTPVYAGIEDEITKSLTVYPNPTSNLLYLESNDFKQYEIMNLVGQSLQTGVIENNAISTAELPGGVYMLHLAGKASDSVVKKFVKE